MQNLLNHINKRAKEVETNSFFKYFDGLNENDRYELLKRFAPSFIHLAMTFKDINLMYLAYDEPKDDYEAEIHSHATADAEHWRFLLNDLELLSLNSERKLTDSIQLIWQPQDAYIREYIYSVLARVSQAKDSITKFVLMEAAEAGVKVFFDTLKKSAKMIYDSRGIKLEYFGDQHIDMEVHTEMDTSVFDTLKIPESELGKYIDLIDAHYEANRVFLNGKYNIALEYIKALKNE